ncbi:MAG: hypothetical protein AB1468_02155 [Candidatus Micrarchaeota archaeon]
MIGMQLTLAEKPREKLLLPKSQNRDELLIKNKAGAYRFPEKQSIFTWAIKKIREKVEREIDYFVYALGGAAFVTFLALTLTFFPKKADAKPPPFYDKPSVFTYGMYTPTIDGMKGEGHFGVWEFGGTYKFPFEISAVGTKTKITGMALLGETKSSTVPRSKFAKFAITSNTTIGEYTISIGLRPIVAFIEDFEFPVGRWRKVRLDKERKFDGDVGIQIQWNQSTGETAFLGVLNSAKVNATRFNAYQTTMDGKWVFSSTFSSPIGYASVFGDTQSDNVGFGIGNMFIRNRGKNRYGFEAGYELGPKSTYGCLVVGLGRTTAVLMTQSDDGEQTSYHALLTFSLAGKEKGKGHGR